MTSDCYRLRSLALRKSGQSRVEETRRRNVHVIKARTIREHSRESASAAGVDPPWSQYFCCMVTANRGWVCKPATEAKFHDDRYTGRLRQP